MVMAVRERRSPHSIILPQSCSDTGHTSAYLLKPGHVICSQPCCSCNIPTNAWVCHQAGCSADTRYGTAPARKHLKHNREASLPCSTKKSQKHGCHWATSTIMQPRPGQRVVQEHLEHDRHAFAVRRRHRDGHRRAEVQPAQRRIHAALNAQPHRKGLLHRHALRAHAHQGLTPLAHDVRVQRTLKCLLDSRQKCTLRCYPASSACSEPQVTELGLAWSLRLARRNHTSIVSTKYPPTHCTEQAFQRCGFGLFLGHGSETDGCISQQEGAAWNTQSECIHKTCVTCVMEIPLTCGRPPQARRRQ